MLRPSLTTAAFALLSASAIAQGDIKSRVQPITSPFKHAGVFHVATGTWTRNGALSNLTGPDTIYNNTCNTGYFVGTQIGEVFAHRSRVPTTAANGAPTTTNAADITKNDEAPGCDTSYLVNGFQIVYCSSLVGPTTFDNDYAFASTYLSCGASDMVPQVTFNVTEPGTYTVRAGYCPEGCFEQYPFTITVEPVIPGGADLSISKSGQPQPVSAGGRLKYLISVANHGPDSARSVTMTDTLPAQVTFASLAAPPTWSCTTPAVGSGGTVTCSKGSMGPRESIDFRVAVDVLPSVPDGSTITNAASVSSGSDDPNAGNDIATATNSVTGSATPGLAKGSGDGQSVPVNTPFPDPLTVIAGGVSPDLGRTGAGASSAAFAASGVTINWSVISGSATLSAPSSVTNGSGVASINVSAGPIAGPIVVRAIRADDPSAQVNFNLTATDDDSSLADLPGLTPTQLALAKVLDELCCSGHELAVGIEHHRGAVDRDSVMP